MVLRDSRALVARVNGPDMRVWYMVASALSSIGYITKIRAARGQLSACLGCSRVPQGHLFLHVGHLLIVYVGGIFVMKAEAPSSWMAAERHHPTIRLMFVCAAEPHLTKVGLIP